MQIKTNHKAYLLLIQKKELETSSDLSRFIQFREKIHSYDFAGNDKIIGQISLL